MKSGTPSPSVSTVCGSTMSISDTPLVPATPRAMLDDALIAPASPADADVGRAAHEYDASAGAARIARVLAAAQIESRAAAGAAHHEMVGERVGDADPSQAWIIGAGAKVWAPSTPAVAGVGAAAAAR